MHVACGLLLGFLAFLGQDLDAYCDFDGELAMRSELQRPIAERVYNLQLLFGCQAIHLFHISASIRQRSICAAPILDARADAITFGLLEALGALARDIRFDAFGSLDVGFQALGGELFGGKRPVGELGRGAIQIILGQLHLDVVWY
jgi:hypothetical protein